ncbi:MAG: class I SAM-dependent methyltransferase [Paludibacteraceae bacterium]|nr:class I SAM-dependent methyltransferase [Paludibacteraceae bacterium]
MKAPRILRGFDILKTASVANTFLATDYAEQMLKVAKKDKRWEQMKNQNIKLDFAQADATALPYSASQFDVVLIANALHIMPNPTAALREISRVLKPDGILIAPTYVHGDNTIWQRISLFPISVRRVRLCSYVLSHQRL